TVDLAGARSSADSSRASYERTLDAIAEIQDSLSAITPNEPLLSPNSSLHAENQIGGPNRTEMLDRIAVLRAGIARSKQRIFDLEQRLRQQGNKVAGLQKMVTHLKQDLNTKQDQLAQLSQQVESLQTQVGGLQTQVASDQDTLHARDTALEDRRREVATVYYVVGTKQELESAGVVAAKGGLLGIGKTILPTGRVDEHAMTPLDTDLASVVETNAAKARVLSAQPPTSYEMRLENGHMELHILDPVSFRTVKHLVIVTA
ncbi:MAG TPA: hypothetical protein VMH61_06855, partial [Candidatus Acidoferrales bacterium]|nr:hypothetical protein [Candidatus Acidoferrales bacterium]